MLSVRCVGINGPGRVWSQNQRKKDNMHLCPHCLEMYILGLLMAIPGIKYIISRLKAWRAEKKAECHANSHCDCK
jgi:hypothetical protein